MKQLYDKMKKLVGKYSKPERLGRDKEGKTITDIQERWNKRVEHFGELLNRPAVLDPQDIEGAHTELITVTLPTDEEITMVIR
ncbi:unnamed protein product [Schistosoma margrebowiei]|uniref:Uncharacterized protein n=1 Tax=Schistosoma margrebowiei TaxID=48269 RepID=A0A183MNJ2_9TREM|nr:unnamed protein product [Schistosoma margrebowiei]